MAVANDLTYASGAFAPKEDAVFRAACELALEERLPLVYLAANSGGCRQLAVGGSAPPHKPAQRSPAYPDARAPHAGPLTHTLFHMLAMIPRRARGPGD